MFTIKYNRTTNHLDGLAIRTQSTGDENGGVVANYSQNACGSITRSRLATGKDFENLTEALEAARIAGGRKLCRNCEKAAEAMLEAMKPVVEEAPEPVVEEAPKVISWTGENLTSVTVKGKKYLVTALHSAGKWVDGEFVKGVREACDYWSDRNGEPFGPTRSAFSDAKPGSVGRMLCEAMRPGATPVLAEGWKEVPHTETGAVVGWLRPGKFRDVSEGMPTA